MAFQSQLWLRRCISYLLTVLVTYTLASIAHSQFVLHELASVGVNIDLGARLETTLSDWLGLVSYAGIIAAGLLVAFVVMGLLKQFWLKRTPGLYMLGGGLAILTALLAMHPIFEVSLIAGARSSVGMLCQILAGVVGGWVFERQLKSEN